MRLGFPSPRSPPVVVPGIGGVRDAVGNSRYRSNGVFQCLECRRRIPEPEGRVVVIEMPGQAYERRGKGAVIYFRVRILGSLPTGRVIVLVIDPPRFLRRPAPCREKLPQDRTWRCLPGPAGGIVVLVVNSPLFLRKLDGCERRGKQNACRGIPGPERSIVVLIIYQPTLLRRFSCRRKKLSQECA